MKKIKYIVISLVFLSLLSCVEEIGDINSSVVTNDKIATDHKSYDVQMTSKDIHKVQTDNINSSGSEYLLGYYNPINYKKINASIVSKLVYSGRIKTEQSSSDDINAYGVKKNIDSTYTLETVILKIPYADRGKDGKFNIDDILGNSTETTSLKVLLNGTYLNKLNPSNPAEKNSYFSDEYTSFQEGDELTTANFEFNPKKKDSVFEFERTNSFNNSKFNDIIIITEKSAKKASKLFLAVPLDMAKMKSLVWDKLNGPKFDSKENFDDYLKGIIIKSVGNQGNLLSLNEKPSIEFYYTITRVENGAFVDTLNKTYSIPLGEIQINTFETSTADVITPPNNLTLQGTSGNEMDLEILTASQLEELKSEKILINDAVLTFYVNKTINTETKNVPERLLLYKQVVKDGVTSSEHIFDIEDANIFSVYGGFLKEKDSKPHVYTLRITEYIKDLIKGNQENTILKLKVFNKLTDLITSKRGKDIVLNNNFRFYNSDPRGVTLYDGSLGNGDNRAQLKISYSKEK